MEVYAPKILLVPRSAVQMIFEIFIREWRVQLGNNSHDKFKNKALINRSSKTIRGRGMKRKQVV